MFSSELQTGIAYALLAGALGHWPAAFKAWGQ
jgi:hypothetical protein